MFNWSKIGLVSSNPVSKWHKLNLRFIWHPRYHMNFNCMFSLGRVHQEVLSEDLKSIQCIRLENVIYDLKRSSQHTFDNSQQYRKCFDCPPQFDKLNLLNQISMLLFCPNQVWSSISNTCLCTWPLILHENTPG